MPICPTRPPHLQAWLSTLPVATAMPGQPRGAGFMARIKEKTATRHPGEVETVSSCLSPLAIRCPTLGSVITYLGSRRHRRPACGAAASPRPAPANPRPLAPVPQTRWSSTWWFSTRGAWTPARKAAPTSWPRVPPAPRPRSAPAGSSPRSGPQSGTGPSPAPLQHGVEVQALVDPQAGLTQAGQVLPQLPYLLPVLNALVPYILVRISFGSWSGWLIPSPLAGPGRWIGVRH